MIARRPLMFSSVPFMVMVVMTIVLGVLPALPVEEASAQNSGQYYANKLLCPPGYDLANSSVQAAFDNCTLPLEQNHSFTIRSNDSSYQGSTQTGAQFGWTDIPLGFDYFVAEALPQGYLEPWVYCEVSQFAAGGGDVQTYYFQAPGGEMFIAGNINAYELTNCTWFNVQAGNGQQNLQPGGTTIAIQKYQCPADYDTSSNLTELLADCTAPQQGALFSLQDDLGNPQQTSPAGQGQFDNVPYGQIELRELKSEQSRLIVAYCRVHPTSETSVTYQETDKRPFDEEQSSYRIDLEVQEGNKISCLFFNLQIPEGASIHIRKYLCPVGFDMSGATLETLNPCPEYEGAEFKVIYGSDETPAQSTNGEGRIDFHGIPWGSVELRETSNPAYRLGKVYCYSVTPEDANGNLSEDDAVSHSEESGYAAVAFDIPDDHDLYCYFFNVQYDDDTPGTITVTKYICPADYDYEGESLADSLNNCGTPHEGAGINLLKPGTGQFGGATDASGEMSWPDFPSGPVTLREMTEGYALVRVFCHGVPAAEQNNAIDEYEESSIYRDGEFYHADTHLEPGYVLHCYLFNMPVDEEAGSLHVTKYLCSSLEVGVGDPITHETFAQQCIDPGVGYTFSVSLNGTDFPGESDDSGNASWPSLAEGNATIEETLPTGYESYAVYCTTDPTTGPWEEYAGDGEKSFAFVVESGVSLYCHWFNWVPDADTYVEVVKYRCPEGYDYASASYEELLTNCSDWIENVPFTITNEDGYESTKPTNTQGVATWTTVPESLVQIREGHVPQYVPVRVFCSNTQAENSVPAPFQGYDLDAVDHYIEIGVLQNYRVVCHWFNAPAETGQIILTKYVCDQFFTRGDAGYQDYVDNCTTPGEGFHFSLVNVDDEVVDEGTTGANGTVPLIAPPGLHYLVETEAEGYIPLAVYCTTDQSTPPTAPLDSPPAVDIAANAQVYCSWFNGEYEPPAYDPGDIVIHKYNCPPGYPTEPTGGRSPFEWLFNGCQQPASGVSFNVEQGGTNVGSGSTDATGTAVIPGVAAGSTRISELPKEGWGPPIILCASYPSTTGRILVSWDEQTVDNWGHTFDIPEDEILECFWFNFPPNQGTDGAPIQIIIHKYLCEEGYAYSGQAYSDISTACTAAENLVNFDLSGGDGSTSGGPTDVNGYAEYNGVVPGSVTITESPRDGYRTLAVYCTNYVTTPTDPSYFSSEEGQLTYYVAPGYKLECYWFNAPAEDYGHIIVVKRSCHEDYDYHSASREELAEDCTNPQNGVTFALTEPGGSENTSTTDGTGLLEWPDVPAGQYSLSETPPDGYYPFRVYCTTYPENEKSPTDPTYSGTWDDYSGDQSTSLAVDLTVQAGYQIYCVWYNVPVEDDYGYVVIIKYNCEEEFDYHSRDEFHAACTETVPQVEFSVSGLDGYSRATTTNATGIATAESVPIGQVQIREYPPEGYAPWRVYCGLSGAGYIPPSSWQDHAFDSGYEITAHIDDPYILWCEWYDVPYEDDPPQVWIQKYNCSEGADWHWSYHEFLSSCHQPGSNVTYGYGLEGSSLQSISTDATGQIHLEDLEPGTFLIQETLPQGYAGFVVFCQFATPHDTGSYQRADVYDRTIKLHLDYGYVVTCVWFDLPSGWEPPDVWPPSSGHPPLQPTFPSGGSGGSGGGTAGGGTSGGGTAGGSIGLPPVDPNTPASLIITKYTCQAGYDLLAQDADAAVDCTELTDEIAFGLASIDDPEFTAQNRKTGDDGEGVVEFTGLPAGAYMLTESLPEGTIAAFIYTCESDRRDFLQENPFIPFAFAGPDGRIGVALVPGETLECDWFDVPEESLGGLVKVTKYACPGSSVIVAQCTVFADGATITLSPAADNESDEVIELLTGEDGTASAPAEGAYTVQEAPNSACLIDSEAFDENGNLVVNEGEEVEVRVYNCNVQS